MKVIGIDPGLNKTGFCVIQEKGSKYKIIDIGVIKPEKNQKIENKINYLYKKLNEISNKYKPDEAAVEELFFVKNVKSGIKVGQMRGVALLVFSQKKIKVFNYTPTKIKLAVVGNGNAKKHQVKEMVKILTGIKNDNYEYDAYDAAAVGICHLNNKVDRYDSIS
jgi:crossover junction endodeoxyribonuclease RuvC